MLALLLLVAGCAKPSSTHTVYKEPIEKPMVEKSNGADGSDAVAESSSQADSTQEAQEEKMGRVEQQGETVTVPTPAGQSKKEGRTDAVQISLDELVERLKKTEAIGFLTKLAIRSDVMDFKTSVDTYRKKGTLKKSIGHLRDHFDGLLLKIMTLLERDPDLSRDIHLARESIWKSLLEVRS